MVDRIHLHFEAGKPAAAPAEEYPADIPLAAPQSMPEQPPKSRGIDA
jgi:hypothetical protein